MTTPFMGNTEFQCALELLLNNGATPESIAIALQQDVLGLPQAAQREIEITLPRILLWQTGGEKVPDGVLDILRAQLERRIEAYSAVVQSLRDCVVRRRTRRGLRRTTASRRSGRGAR